jgi:hypothetical protein
MCIRRSKAVKVNEEGEVNGIAPCKVSGMEQEEVQMARQQQQ